MATRGLHPGLAPVMDHLKQAWALLEDAQQGLVNAVIISREYRITWAESPRCSTSRRSSFTSATPGTTQRYKPLTLERLRPWESARVPPRADRDDWSIDGEPDQCPPGNPYGHERGR